MFGDFETLNKEESIKNDIFNNKNNFNLQKNNNEDDNNEILESDITPFTSSNFSSKSKFFKNKDEDKISSFSYKIKYDKKVCKGSSFKKNEYNLSYFSMKRLNEFKKYNNNNNIINIDNLNKDLFFNIKLVPSNPYYFNDDIHNLKYYFGLHKQTNTFKNDDFSQNKSKCIFNDFNSIIILLFGNNKNHHLFSSVTKQRLLFTSLTLTDYNESILFSNYNDNNIRFFDLSNNKNIGLYKYKSNHTINRIETENNKFVVSNVKNNLYYFDLRVKNILSTQHNDCNKNILNDIKYFKNYFILNNNKETLIYDTRNKEKLLFKWENQNKNISKIKILKDKNKIFRNNIYSNKVEILDLNNFTNINNLNLENNIIDFDISNNYNELYFIVEDEEDISIESDLSENEYNCNFLNKSNKYLDFKEYKDDNLINYERITLDKNTIKINNFGNDSDILIQTPKKIEIYLSREKKLLDDINSKIKEIKNN